MGQNPKVSVIIPAYNHEKYIAKTINSVLEQSFEDFELLIADDFSTDKTREIIEGICDNRIQKFYFNKNMGVVNTLNFLQGIAKGEYIATLGSDDMWYKDKLKKQTSVLDENKNIGGVFSNATIIDENDEKYLDDKIFNINIFLQKNATRGEWLRRFYNQGNMLCHSSALIRSCVIRDIGDYNIAYCQLHDFEYWTRLLNKYEIYTDKTELLAYRRAMDDKTSISSSDDKKTTRMINENYFIFYNLFNNIDQRVLLEGFFDLFLLKESYNLTCEKYFLLDAYKIMDVNNKQLSINYLYEHLKDQNVALDFEEKYGITLNDIYKKQANVFVLYPDSLIDKKEITQKIEQVRQEFFQREQEIYNSKSWKITAPLRKITELFKK